MLKENLNSYGRSNSNKNKKEPEITELGSLKNGTFFLDKQYSTLHIKLYCEDESTGEVNICLNIENGIKTSYLNERQITPVPIEKLSIYINP